MISTVAEVRSTFAVRRVDRLIGKLFTLSTLMTLYEMFMNALGQRQFLNPFWQSVALSLLIGAQLFNLINFWFWRGVRWGYLVHGLSYVVAFFTWGLQYSDSTYVPVDFKPWLWWATGSAAMAFGMYIPRLWAFAAMAFVPLTWGLLRLTPGGNGQIGDAIADTLYSTLFPATIVGLVYLVREGADRVDLAGEASRREVSELVRREAEARERTRLDAILYSSVLASLRSAAKAKDSKEYKQVLEVTRQGMEQMEQARNAPRGKVSTLSLFDTLSRLAKRLDPTCEIVVTGASTFSVSYDVATALTDAMTEALENSILHAGSGAKRKLRLRGSEHGLKIVLTDDGFGFRPSRVPKHSLGLRLLILERVQSVGGSVFIDSKPGSGATIGIEWGSKSD